MTVPQVTILYQGTPVSATNPLPVTADSVTFPNGMPEGGTGGQVLTKDSEADYDATWQDLTDDLPVGGAAGQVLIKNSATDYDATWGDVTADIGAVTATRATEARTLADRFADSVHLLDFIPVEEHAAIYTGDSTYDCSDAMETALASVEVMLANPLFAGGPEIVLPYGMVRLSRTIQLKKGCTLRGQGANSANGGSASILEFAAYAPGTESGHGILFLPDNGTYDGTGAATGSGTCCIRDFEIRSLGMGAGATVGHGIWARQRFVCERVKVINFPQDGVHIEATESSSGVFHGNANNCYVAQMRITGCGRHGFYVDGADANACYFAHIDSSANWGMGFYDGSFLGNVHIAPHTNGNGVGGQVSHTDGFRYYTMNPDLAGLYAPGDGVGSMPDWLTGTTYAVGDYVESRDHVYECMVAGGGTSTNQPIHTTAAGDVPKADGYTWRFSGWPVWLYINAGGLLHPSYPQWVSGNTYVLGHAFLTTSNNADGGIVIGLYFEGGQPTCHFTDPWLIISPLMPHSPYSGGFLIQNSLGEGKLTNFYVSSRSDNSVAFTTHLGRLADEAITVIADGDNSPGFAPVFWDSTNNCWSMCHNRVSHAVRFTTALSSGITGGRASALAGGRPIFSLGLWLGSTLATARQITNATTAPTTGEWAAGDLVLNSAPLIGEPWGWRCILTGDFALTPPVFQPLRDLGSQQTVATNANFTLTPGTSPYQTLHTGTLTADRAVTLSTTGALVGLGYRITRTGAGAFNLNVGTGPLKALVTNTWCEVMFDGTAYYLSAYGAL